MGRGRGCCSLLKHIYTVSPRTGISSWDSLWQLSSSYSVTYVRDVGNQQLLREGQMHGVQNHLSVHTQFSLSFLLQHLLCQGSSWGRENHLVLLRSLRAVWEHCCQTASLQTGTGGWSPQAPAFPAFHGGSAGEEGALFPRASSAFLIWALCVSPPLLLDHLWWNSHGGIFSWKLTFKYSNMESSSLP